MTNAAELAQKIGQFMATLSEVDADLLVSGHRSLAVVDPALLVAAQTPLPMPIARATFPALLAAALNTGEAADVAAAIKAMRAEGWGELAQRIAGAFAELAQQRGSELCACAHPVNYHTSDLGCWSCVCQVGAR